MSKIGSFHDTKKVLSLATFLNDISKFLNVHPYFLLFLKNSEISSKYLDFDSTVTMKRNPLSFLVIFKKFLLQISFVLKDFNVILKVSLHKSPWNVGTSPRSQIGLISFKYYWCFISLQDYFQSRNSSLFEVVRIRALFKFFR